MDGLALHYWRRGEVVVHYGLCIEKLDYAVRLAGS